MTLTAERRRELLAYCRIDESELSEDERLLLESLYEASVGYMSGAGIPEPSEAGAAAQYRLCVNALVLEAWDRRDMTEAAPGREGGGRAENPALRRILNQLKLTAGNGNTDAG